MHYLPVIFIILGSMLSLSQSGLADPPRASHDHWRNINYHSHYVLYDQASRTWIETVNCRALYRFTLVANEMNTLTLYDASRGMTIRLNYEGMWLKPANARDFTFYQPGTFDTRTQFEHNQAGTYTGSIVKKPACRWEEWFPGARSPAYAFVQTGVTNEAVDLFDASRNIGVRLGPNVMLLRQGSAPLSFFKNGRWRG